MSRGVLVCVLQLINIFTLAVYLRRCQFQIKPQTNFLDTLSSESILFSIMSENSILVLLADGFEEIEAITIIDVLRRANIDTTTASIHQTRKVTGDHNIVVEADVLLSEVADQNFSMVVLPGGVTGVNNLTDSSLVKTVLDNAVQNGKKVGAICAAPSLLSAHGLLKDKQATSYPAFKDQVIQGGAKYSEARVITDGNTITSRGVGTALDFALEIVKSVHGQDVADDLAQKMLVTTE